MPFPECGEMRSVDVEQEKRLAAEAAAELVEDGMSVGPGTGSTARRLHFPGAD
jgi:ribose 5-phosphate isomerase A